MIFIYALSLTALLCCSTFVLLFISVESRRPKLAVNLSGLLTISLFLWCTAQLVPILPEIRVGPTALPPGSLRAAQQQSYLQKHLVVGAAQETSDVPTLNSSHYSPSQDHTTVSTVLFIHLPKTGGTTLACHLQSYFGRKFIHYWQKPSKERNFHESSGKTCIFGHLPFGFHKFLPAEKLQDSIGYATFLRHPIDRVISHYYYHKKTVIDPWHRTAARLNLTEWVQTSDFANNFQTQMLAGMGAWWNEDNELTYLPPREIDENGQMLPRSNLQITQAHFDLAADQLKKCFIFVGLKERYPESLAIFESMFSNSAKAKNCGYAKKTIHPPSASLSAAELKLIRQYNKWDLKLYRLAVSMFNKQVQLYLPKLKSARLDLGPPDSPTTSQHL